MAAPLPTRRAALFLDFDNVFGALAEIDEAAAWDFANEPGRWLDWFAAGTDGGALGGRRLLVRRCYMNAAGSCPLAPQGALAAQLGAPRVQFSRFRSNLIGAGFQVVDCPSLTGLGKNAADITMVLDIMDALSHPTRFDEFLLLASDADFTPLLHRLRAHDRQVLVVAHKNTARAFRAATDVALELAGFAETALARRGTVTSGAAAPPAAAMPAPAPGAESTAPASPEAQQAKLLKAIRAILAASPQPVHLGQLGKRLRLECGPWVSLSRHGGAGSLQKLIEGKPGLALKAGSGGTWLLDAARHAQSAALRAPGSATPSNGTPATKRPVPPAAPPADPPGPASAEAQQAMMLGVIRTALAASRQPLHLGQLGQRLRQTCGDWVSSSRYGGTGSLQKLVSGQHGWAVEIGPGGGWLFDPARHQRPSANGEEPPAAPFPLPPPDPVPPRPGSP